MVALEFLFSARNHSELEAVDATLGDPMTASAEAAGIGALTATAISIAWPR